MAEARLIRPAELLARLGDPDLVVLDVRVRYVDEAATADHDGYLAGHVPGAVFADVVHALSDNTDELAFRLPSPERFAREIGALGVGEGTRVVLYSEGWPIWATRVWWLLRYYGFSDVALLDGGWQGWSGAGNPVETGPRQPRPRQFVPRTRPELLATLDEVTDTVAGHRHQQLVNALPHAMFTGEIATHGTVHGRIPGSLSLPWTDTADVVTGVYESEETITDAASVLPTDVPVIAYCGGGVSATALIFGLALAGRTDVKLYDGSMDEWAADPARPLERDVEPDTER